MANSPSVPFMNRGGFGSRSVPRLGFGTDAVVLSKSSEQWQKQLDDADQQQAQLFHLQWGLIKEQMTNMRTDIVNLTEAGMQKEAEVQQLNAGMNQLSENFGGAIQNLEVQMMQQMQAMSQEFRMSLDNVKTERDVAMDRFESRFVELEASTRQRATAMEEQVTAVKSERDSQRATYRRWEQTIESVEQKLSTPDHIQQLFAALQERLGKQDELRIKMQQDLERADAAIRQDVATMKTQHDSKHHELRTDITRKHSELQGHHDKLRQAVDEVGSNHEQLQQAHELNSDEFRTQLKEQARTKGWHQDINDLRSKLTEHQRDMKGEIDAHRSEVADKHVLLADELRTHQNVWNGAHGELKQSINQLGDRNKEFHKHVKGLEEDVKEKHSTAITKVKEYGKTHEAQLREVDSQLQSHLQKMSTDHSNSHDAVRNNLSVLDEEIRRELGAIRNSHDEHRGHVKDVFEKHKSDSSNKQQELLNLLNEHRDDSHRLLRTHAEKQDRYRSDMRAAHDATEGHLKKQLERISKDHAEKHGGLREALDGHRSQAEKMVKDLTDLSEENHTGVKEQLQNVAKTIRKELADVDEEHKSNHGRVRELMSDHKNDHSSALTDLGAALRKDLRVLGEEHGNAHQATKDMVTQHKALLERIPLAEQEARHLHKEELVDTLEKLKVSLQDEISTLHQEHSTGHQQIQNKFEEHRHEALSISEQIKATLEGQGQDHSEKASSLEKSIMELEDTHRQEIHKTRQDVTEEVTDQVDSTHSKLLQIITGHKNDFDTHKNRHYDPLRTVVKRLEVQLQHYQDRLDLVETAVTREDEELKKQSDAFKRQMEEMERHMQDTLSKEDESMKQAMLDHDEETREQMRIVELKMQESLRKEDVTMRKLLRQTNEDNKRQRQELEKRMQGRVNKEEEEMHRLAIEGEERQRRQMAQMEGRLQEDNSRETAELRRNFDDRDAATMRLLRQTNEDSKRREEELEKRMQGRVNKEEEEMHRLAIEGEERNRKQVAQMERRLHEDISKEDAELRRALDDRDAATRKRMSDLQVTLQTEFHEDEAVLRREMQTHDLDYKEKFQSLRKTEDGLAHRMKGFEDQEKGLERRMGGYEDHEKALERRMKGQEDHETALERRMKGQEDHEKSLERRMAGFEDDEKDMRAQMKGLRQDEDALRDKVTHVEQEEDSMRKQMAQREKRPAAGSGEGGGGRGGGRGGGQGGVNQELQAKLEAEISKLWEALETHTHETLPGGGVGRAVLPGKVRYSEVHYARLQAPAPAMDPIVQQVSVQEVVMEPIIQMASYSEAYSPATMMPTTMMPTYSPTVMSSQSFPSLARTVVQPAPAMSPVGSPTGSRRMLSMPGTMSFPGFSQGSVTMGPRMIG